MEVLTLLSPSGSDARPREDGVKGVYWMVDEEHGHAKKKKTTKPFSRRSQPWNIKGMKTRAGIASAYPVSCELHAQKNAALELLSGFETPA